MCMKTSNLLIKRLVAHGVTHIFWVPWEENLDILESIRDHEIEIIVTKNEQTAVFMAATHGRLTGKIGVALTTLGPWATNAMTWIAHAFLGGFPVMLISWQKPIRESKQGKFQIIDVVGTMKPITKFSTTIIDGRHVPDLVDYAILLAESEKPGPVHLELPEDIAADEVEIEFAPIPAKTRRPVVEEKALENLITRLEWSRSPVLLVGAWANRKRISTRLIAFVKQTWIPFFCTQMGKWVVDERLSQYLWTAALTSNDGIHEAISKSDLILSIGHDSIEKPTHHFENQSIELIHINFTHADYNDLYRPSLQVVGDIGNVFWKLHEESIDTSSRDHVQMLALGEKHKQSFSASDSDISWDVLWPRELVRMVRNNLNDDAILTLDNWLYKVWFARNYETYLPNTLLLDNALATMGAGYSTGMMAALEYPDRQIVTVVGDGGLVMNLGDLQTAVSLWVNLTVILLVDNAYGMIKWKQKNHHFGDFGLDFDNPDFIKLAEAFGAKWLMVDSPDMFGQVLKNWLAYEWVSIVVTPFEYPMKIC